MEQAEGSLTGPTTQAGVGDAAAETVGILALHRAEVRHHAVLPDERMTITLWGVGVAGDLTEVVDPVGSCFETAERAEVCQIPVLPQVGMEQTVFVVTEAANLAEVVDAFAMCFDGPGQQPEVDEVVLLGEPGCRGTHCQGPGNDHVQQM